MVVVLLVEVAKSTDRTTLERCIFCMCVPFYHIFYALEDADLLDPSNNADLFAQHFVYLPCINQQLDTFRQSEGNMTSHQLWIEGIARLNTDPFAVDGAQECTIIMGGKCIRVQYYCYNIFNFF